MTNSNERAHELHRKWQVIVRELENEQNPERIVRLAAELNQAMLEEERNKVRRALASRPDST